MKSKVYMVDKKVRVFHGEDYVNLTTGNKERIKTYWNSLDKEGKNLIMEGYML